MEQEQSRIGVKLFHLGVPLSPEERARVDRACGPGRPIKRGAWVREAILQALDREEAKEETA